MKRATLEVLLAVLALAPLVAVAADGDTVGGEVELGYRYADVGGNSDKYREDVNLSDEALRLFGLRLEVRPDEVGLFDRLDLSASGLGGEPYSAARLSLSKTRRYDLDLRFRSSDRFYRDAGYLFRAEGDLHDWNASRKSYDLALRIEASERVRVRFGADRMEREGGSTTSLDVQREVFVLTRPVDQTASTYWAAVDVRAGWADLSLEHRRISHENRWRLTTAASDGQDPGDAFLDAYDQLRIEDADAPLTRLSMHGRPSRRLSFSASYARIDADLDHSTSGSWDGLDFNGDPFATTLSNAGRVERTSDLLDAGVTVAVRGNVDVGIEFSHRSYDQDGTIDLLETQVGGADDGQIFVQGDLTHRLDLDSYRATIDWRVTPELSLAAGVGLQEREADFQLAGPVVETSRTVYRAAIGWRPESEWNLRLDLERGDDDDPYTRVSPTTTDRIRLRASYRPTSRLTLALSASDESKENELRYALGLPTDDTPPANEVFLAEFDSRSVGLTLSWTGERYDVMAGYLNAEIDSDAHIVYVTGSTFVPQFDLFTTRDRTDYSADQDVLHASARFRLPADLSAGASFLLADNSGSFPVESTSWGAHLRWDLKHGIFLRVALRSYDYDETNPFAGDPATPTPSVNDYDADLWTVSAGYRF